MPADSENDKAPAAPPPAKTARLRVVLFGVLGGMVLTTLAAATWFAFFRAPDVVEVFPPPPALKPTPPTVVREGDLGDELWRRLGVRPEQD